MTREQKKDLLLKMNGLRKCNRLPWAELAYVWEAESGEAVDPESLRRKVAYAVRRNTDRMVADARAELEKVSVEKSRTSIWGWIKSKFRR